MSDNISEFDLSMPIMLIRTELKNQIEGTSSILQFRKDLINIFNMKVETNTANYEDEDNDVETDSKTVMDNEIDNFYSYALSLLKSIIGIEYDTCNDGINRHYIHKIYTMFVLNLNKNVTAFLTQYILLNKNTLFETYNIKSNSNITVKSARKLFKNRTDSIIVINSARIVEDILRSEIINPELFINTLFELNNMDQEYSVIKNLYENCILTFNVDLFLNYIKIIFAADEYVLSTLKNNITEYLMNSFPERDDNI